MAPEESLPPPPMRIGCAIQVVNGQCHRLFSDAVAIARIGAVATDRPD